MANQEITVLAWRETEDCKIGAKFKYNAIVYEVTEIAANEIVGEEKDLGVRIHLGNRFKIIPVRG